MKIKVARHFLLVVLVGFNYFANGQVVCGDMEYEKSLELQFPNSIGKKDTFELEQAQFKIARRSNPSTFSGTVTIPVVVFFIGNNVINTVPISKVTEQIQILNDNFISAGIQFCLTQWDVNGNPDAGIHPIYGNFLAWDSNSNDPTDPTSNYTLKKLIHWDAHKVLNLYVADLPTLPNGRQLAAYAQFPFHMTDLPDLDGIVIDPRFFGTSNSPDQGQGKIAVHEVGHWLGLYHTWGDKSDCSGTDYVDDTPVCSGQTGGIISNSCASFQQCSPENATAGLTDFRQIENFMDYSDQPCRNLFTPGQVLRMESTLNLERPFQAFISCNGSCHNNIQDQGETGIDCGGPCPACSNTGGGGGGGSAACRAQPPDQYMKINGTLTGVVNVCPGGVVMLEDMEGSPHGGTQLGTASINVSCDQALNGCTWWQQFFGKCQCKTILTRYYVAIYTDCDDFYTCPTLVAEKTIERSYLLTCQSFTFDVGSELGYAFQPGQRYVIKLAGNYFGGFDDPGVPIAGFRSVYVNNYNLNLSNITLTSALYSAASHITTQEVVESSANPVSLVAGVEIEFLPNTSISGELAGYIDPQLPCYDGMRVGNTSGSPDHHKGDLNESPLSINGSSVNSQTMLKTILPQFLLIHPNPANDKVILDYSVDASSLISINIYNSLGLKLTTVLSNLNQDVGNYTQEINVSGLVTGYYYLEFLAGFKRQFIKFVIIRN